MTSTYTLGPRDAAETRRRLRASRLVALRLARGTSGGLRRHYRAVARDLAARIAAVREVTA